MRVAFLIILAPLATNGVNQVVCHCLYNALHSESDVNRALVTEFVMTVGFAPATQIGEEPL